MQQSLDRGQHRGPGRRAMRAGAWAKLLVLAPLAALGCGGRTDQAATCSAPTGCGGDLTGTWDVTSMCTRVHDGAVVPTSVPECEPVTRHALDVAVIVPQDVTATFTKDSYFRTGSATLETSYVFTDNCLAATGYDVASTVTCNIVGANLSAGPSFAGFGFTPTVVTCTLDSTSCVCQVSANVTIGDSGSYVVSGSEIFFNGNAPAGTYCAGNDRAVISTDSTVTTERWGLRRKY